MKKIIISILALAALFSCTKEQTAPQEQPSEKKGTTYSIEFSAPCNEDGTKITLDGYDGSTYSLKWCVGDVLQMYTSSGSTRIWIGETDTLTAADIDKTGNATFRFTTSEEAGTVLKFNLNSNLDDSNTYGYSTLPSEQVQNGLGTDNTDITPYDYTFLPSSVTLGTTTKVSSDMRRPLATVKVPFWSTTYEGWKVEKITLSRSDLGQVAGYFGTNSAALASQSFIKITAADIPVISLTFNNDVAVPADEDSAEPAFLQVFPTEKYSSTSTPSAVPYVVMIQISKDGVRKYFARKFTALMESGKVKNLQVGQLEASDSKFQVKEYSKIWERGGDITFAGVTFNRNTEGYESMSKVEASALIYTTMNTGGLIFVTDDDETPSIVDLSTDYATNQPIANKKDLTLVGDRIYDGGQTSFKVVEMRTYGNVLFANLKLIPVKNTTTPSYLFSKQSTDTKSTSLRMADCQVDGTGIYTAVIGDRNGNGTNTSAAYSSITVDNCVIKLPADKPFYKMLATDDETTRTITLNNNVFWWEAATSATAANIICFNGKTAANLSIATSCNTIENCFPAGVIYAYINNTSASAMLKDVTSDKDLVYVHDMTALTFSTGKYLSFYSGKIGTCTDGYMAAYNCYNSKSSAQAYLSPWYFNSLTGTNYGSSCTACPFVSSVWSEATGYFPVDRSIVTNGAGASYDTKYYFAK